jgi:hypothetical protein
VSRKYAELIYTSWERFLNAHSEAFGGDREFTELSNKLDQARAAVFADREVTAAELDALVGKMEAVAGLFAEIAARRGIALDAALPATRESFRVFREEAEIHFQTLAGGDGEHYRGGLIARLAAAPDPAETVDRIVLDLLTSASSAIAADKVYLLRARLSLLEDPARRRELLDRVRDRLAAELRRPVWSSPGGSPAIDIHAFDRLSRFESLVAARPVPLPPEILGTNALLPNRPVQGRDAAMHEAVRALLADLGGGGRLFLDRVPAATQPATVALKIELNLGIDGPPSVTDPAATYAVVSALLQMAAARGRSLRFTVGDSNGIENAPIGRTTLDVMRDTGNYHAALKAALEFASRDSMPEAMRGPARASLAKLAALEAASPPVYFGSPEDRVSSPRDLEAAEAAAAPWVVCVDYDGAGYRQIETAAGPLGRAVWGSSRFHVAEPWVAASYRVHVSRGVSTHLFAGWTGALKGLVGLHALGGRPADHGMRQRGQGPLDILTAVMQAGGITGMFETRSGVGDFAALARGCDDERCRDALRRAAEDWNEILRLGAGRAVWAAGARAIEQELRRDQAAGVSEIEIMAKMRRATAALLDEAERAAPGFRASLLRGVAGGTRAFLLTMWRMRQHIPAVMRDERLGLRIGILSRLPHASDLVVQSLPKIGLGGGPDSYFEVRDVGVVVAGLDEVSVDLAALRAAAVPGHPWADNHPVYGALQLGPGPAGWEEIRSAAVSAAAR